MMSVSAHPRVVVVLGSSPGVDGAELVQDTSLEQAELTLLSFGFPVTAQQQHVIAEAMAEADRLGVYLQVLLVPSPAELLREVRPNPTARIAAVGRDRKHIERALRGHL